MAQIPAMTLRFRLWLGGSWALFILLQLVTYLFEPYRYFPFYGFAGYVLTIAMALVALAFANRQLHYILQSMTLIIFGAVASIDIIWSKQEIFDVLMARGWDVLTPAKADGYIQILIVLMNIFTGSLASSSLFHGLNRRNFTPD